LRNGRNLVWKRPLHPWTSHGYCNTKEIWQRCPISCVNDCNLQLNLRSDLIK
jgi:hypothetical protein